MKKETTQNQPLRGEKLAKAVINQILSHPESWNQRTWHTSCGTKHCFAGWAQVLGGGNPKEYDAQTQATQFLEISPYKASALFAGDATLPMLYSFARDYSKERDSDGYDRAGYDRAGYDRAGYNRDGYDCDGTKLELTPFEL